MENPTKKLQSATIGEIVAENYLAAGVFKKYNIDFCCGGGISLKEACTKKKLNYEVLAKELLEVSEKKETQTENYKAWPADFLIDYIVRLHHTYVRSKLEELPAYTAKVVMVYGERYPEMIEIHNLFDELKNEMLHHMAAEENEVFPLIKKLDVKASNGEAFTAEEIRQLEECLVQMETEHEGAGGLMKKIREVSHDFAPPEDACTTFRVLLKNLEDFEKDLHKHVHLENNILFPKAKALAG